jgi:ubiquinone/menaquinone biosynthesis C-methylase UbiE
MDRITWLREMRRDCEQQYDTRLAPFYGEKWGLYSTFAHQQFIQEFLSLLSRSSMILDAACGAGGYLPLLLEKEHSVIGIDQSQGMLARAKAKFPSVQFEKVGLQEMAYREVFDGVICMDAMKYVCPEDWPLVLSNFYRALKQDGYLYFTAETIENADEKKSSKPSKELNKLGYRLFMESGQTKVSIIIFRPINRSRSGLNKQYLKFSKKGMGRYITTICWYERF